MPPKPTSSPRKPSVASKHAHSALPKTENPHTMPPPPDPPQGILVPEITALSNCIQNIAVKTGQIHGFFADAQRLGIQRHAPNPPRSLTASLGREVEKYDQLCDALELRLTRAISVLQRDLERERARIQEEERVKADIAAKEAASKAPSTQPTASPPQPTSTSPSTSVAELQVSPTERKPFAVPRRASTISLSSLHRPAFPHKLDLSSLAFNPEDALPLHSGQASPVTLAPKSSVPRSSMPPDLLSVGGQTVDIDLTLDDDDVAMAMNNPGDASLGTSVDKPIELDLDELDELFTESNNQNLATASIPPDVGSANNDAQMSDIFNALQTGSDSKPPDGSLPSAEFSGMEQLMQSAQTQDQMQIFPNTAEATGQGTNQSGDSGMNLPFGDLSYLTGEVNMQELFSMNSTEGFAGGTS